MGGNPALIWSDHDEQILRQRWADGRTAEAISRELNRTRSAVCGKINRLHLQISNQRDPNRHQTVLYREVKQQARKPGPLYHPKAPLPVIETKPSFSFIGPTKPVALQDLRRGHCRELVDGSDKANPLYCGRPRIKIGMRLSPYCVEHHAINTQPSRN